MSHDAWIGSMNEDSMYAVQLDKHNYIVGGFHPDSGIVNIYKIEKYSLRGIRRNYKNKITEYRFEHRISESNAKDLLKKIFDTPREPTSILQTLDTFVNNSKWKIEETANIDKEEINNYVKTAQALIFSGSDS